MTMELRALTEGQEVDAVLLVRERSLRPRGARGDTALRLVLGDRSGTAEATIWDDVERLGELCPQGAPVHVRGRYSVHARYGPQIALSAIQAVDPEGVDWPALLDGPAQPFGAMEQALRALLDTIREPHLRALLDRVFAPGSELWSGFAVAPAAKRYHQAYRHGLFEHSLTVALGVAAMAETFPGIDRDVAVTGALLHDIGKLEAYTHDPCAIDLTDLGRLQGEIPLGYYRVRRLIEDLEGFPAELAGAVLHIILSHHGQLEYGSPVTPCTREATLVHMIDNLGGRLGSFDRLEKSLPEGARWSGYDRALGGAAHFGARPGPAPATLAA